MSRPLFDASRTHHRPTLFLFGMMYRCMFPMVSGQLLHSLNNCGHGQHQCLFVKFVSVCFFIGGDRMRVVHRGKYPSVAYVSDSYQHIKVIINHPYPCNPFIPMYSGQTTSPASSQSYFYFWKKLKKYSNVIRTCPDGRRPSSPIMCTKSWPIEEISCVHRVHTDKSKRPQTSKAKKPGPKVARERLGPTQPYHCRCCTRVKFILRPKLRTGTRKKVIYAVERSQDRKVVQMKGSLLNNVCVVSLHLNTHKSLHQAFGEHIKATKRLLRAFF